MNILFFLRHPLYLRNFESVLRDLDARGHKVRLVFTPLEKEVDQTLLDDLLATCEGLTTADIAPRTGWWWPVSDALRTLRDYLRYLEPDYHDAPALVARGARRLPPFARAVYEKIPGLKSAPIRRLTAWLARLLDAAIPADPGCVDMLRRAQPDLVMASPMIDFTYAQTDFVKAAKQLGIPTLLAVASWDNLTNKGLVQVAPDRTLVWNRIQADEAVRMHRLPPDSLKITGAQLFDHWFEMTPSTTREAFCARVGGLDPAKPILLYLCSSTFISRNERTIVEDWLTALRESGDARLADANVIIRPHPSNYALWDNADMSAFGRVAVWPSTNGVPVDDERKRDYFDSLFHSAAVIGVNTSGFLEAGIVGRRTLGLATGHFDATQEGTLHFRYLTAGGLVTIARSFDEHVAQLQATLDAPEATEKQVTDFITSFLRPAGLGKPATPIFVEALEEAAHLTPPRTGTMPLAALVRAAALPVAYVVRRAWLERLNPGTWRGIETTAKPRFVRPRGQSTKHSEGKIAKFTGVTTDALEEIAKSDKPIIVGPWVSEVGFEILYWIPFLKWAQAAYGIAPERFIVVSRGGVAHWYGALAHRYYDLLDHFSPDAYVAFNEARQKKSGMQKQKKVAKVEKELAAEIARHFGEDEFDILHPQIMYSGLLRYHWSQRSAMDHLFLHARYEPMPLPEPGDIEARLPDDYYAVRFYTRESFAGGADDQAFVRRTIEHLLTQADVVLLNTPFTLDDHESVSWMEARANGDANDGGNHRLIQASEWMTPGNNLDVQTRIIARSRGFVGTYGGLSYLAPYFGKPSIAFYSARGDLSDAHFNTAKTVFTSFGVPFVVLSPEEMDLLRPLA